MTDLRDDDTRTNRLGDLVRDITGSIPRARAQSFERTRTHHVVSSRPEPRPVADPTDDWAPLDHWLEPEPNRARRAIDPTLLRLGAVAAAGLLMIPLALALREDEPSLQADQASVTTLAPQQLAVPPTTVTVPPTVAPAPAPVAAVAASVADDEAVAAAAAVHEQPACAGTYVVIANDFWNRFPATSGASVAEWLAANGATADTPLYVGDELCIPAGAAAPAPPPPTTAVPTTAAPATTAAAVPAPTPAAVAPAAPPAPAVAPAVTAAAAPPPPAPVVTAAPAPIPAGATSTDALCGALPTSNGNPAGTPGPAQVEALIREIWPDDVEVRALCIAKREARLRADLNNWCCYGVFALYFDYVPADLKATFGVDAPADLYDARTNIAIAYQIYVRGGWDPWSQTDPGSG